MPVFWLRGPDWWAQAKNRYDLWELKSKAAAQAQVDWDQGEAGYCVGISSVGLQLFDAEYDRNTGLPYTYHGGGCLITETEIIYRKAYNDRIARLITEHGNPASAVDWVPDQEELDEVIAAADWQPFAAEALPENARADREYSISTAQIDGHDDYRLYRSVKSYDDGSATWWVSLYHERQGKHMIYYWTGEQSRASRYKALVDSLE